VLTDFGEFFLFAQLANLDFGNPLSCVIFIELLATIQLIEKFIPRKFSTFFIIPLRF